MEEQIDLQHGGATMLDTLRGTHEELARMADDVAESIREDDREIMHDDFAELERRLLDHMSWEEMYILPTYGKRQPAEAAEIRAEHAEFRARLGEIGIAIDLHTVRANNFEELAARIRDHADREEAMYTSISNELGDETYEAVDNQFHRFFAIAKRMPMVSP